MPQSIVGLDTLLLAVVVVHLGKAKDVEGKLQAIIVVEELNGAGNSEDDISVVLDRQGVDDARVLANPIARTGDPVIPRDVALATLHLCQGYIADE